ncbi:MAG: RtcB family protein, partial [Myxococcota bacterium]
VRHPDGGEVCAAFATPDFHPGARVPVGAVVATSTDMVIPQAIGTDIQCGMRLHASDLSIDRFLSGKEQLIDLLRGDLLLGTRDLPMRVSAMKALFSAGCVGWHDAASRDPLGRLAGSDWAQLETELDRVYRLGSEDGDPRWAPGTLMPDDRDIIRDPTIGTVGGGNHFVELQVVAEILDRRRAYAWGIRKGAITAMIHSGSRLIGVHIGNDWMARAKQRWPTGVKHPTSGIYPLHGEVASQYLEAMNTAANYASVNRLLLGELVRLRMREVYGDDIEAPLVFDVPHNIVLREGDLYVHRKGATPAHAEQPVLIPGSMGHPSFLMVGLGNERYLSSASHGAGRALTRFAMRQRRPDELGLSGVECITLKKERLIQEAPAAYKPIQPVVDIQAEAGIVAPVARFTPLLTFKA